MTYQFEPGDEADGVTVHVPLAVLGQLDPAQFTWQVPGLRAELVTALIRGLPKSIRRSYVPAPNFATAALSALKDRVGQGDLRGALADALQDMGGVRIEDDDWALDRLPAHLRMRFAVHAGADPSGPMVASGEDLSRLAEQLAPRTADALGEATASAGPDLRRRGLHTWEPGQPPDLPDVVEVQRAGATVHGHPALVDDGDSVSVQVLGTADEARRSHARGLRRLLALDLPDPSPAAVRTLGNQQRLVLAAAPHRGGTRGRPGRRPRRHAGPPARTGAAAAPDRRGLRPATRAGPARAPRGVRRGPRRRGRRPDAEARQVDRARAAAELAGSAADADRRPGPARHACCRTGS